MIVAAICRIAIIALMESPAVSTVQDLLSALEPMRFAPPIACVYNPLEYARQPYEDYLRRYGSGRKEILMVGMNPGPWGMAQTGVPFGEIRAVTEWMNIRAAISQPRILHPKRPVLGFACARSEVSGKRLWGWARNRFGSPGRFFSRFFVVNYCPLMFMDAQGKNITPDKLPSGEQKNLFAACDRALAQIAVALQPRFVFGIGAFAANRVRSALAGSTAVLSQITHPSPANPKANKGWEALAEKELTAAGVLLG